MKIVNFCNNFLKKAKVFTKCADIYIEDTKRVDTSPQPSPQGEGDGQKKGGHLS